MSLSFLRVLVLTFLPILAISQDLASLSTENQVLNSNIKTILLFPTNDARPGAIRPAAVPIQHPYSLVLKFDELFEDEAFIYNAKIFHCNANWERSLLRENQYLYDYNEFTIDRYEFSQNRIVPYTHYTFELPKVKVPGNYILVVYRESNENEVAFIKRFYAFDQNIGVEYQKSIIGSAIQQGNQMVEFTINYSNYSVLNPLQDIKVVIRQNDRWDNALTDLKPTLFRDDLQQLVFRNYHLENSFQAGNEFRFFDLTSVRYSMQNVSRIDETRERIDAYLSTDKFRGYEAYSSVNEDLNGGYFIENKDYGNPHVDSEYVYTHFSLETPTGVRDDIYIGGKLTGWTTEKENSLHYVPDKNLYTGTLLLKQGYYDYQYIVPGYAENPNIIEGNHFETQNFYEILVYYRHPTMRADLLVGYQSFISQ